jgi:uncharacterized protein DUF5309
MAFSGMSTSKYFTANEIGEDISEIIRRLAPYEAPVLDWLGDAATVATNTRHEFFDDYLRPRRIITSTAINSAAAATPIAIAINGLGEALTVGTILENTTISPERYQVSSIIAGGSSIVMTRAYDGAAVGSLAVGGTLIVRAPTAPEGDEHQGLHTARLGTRRANTVGYFKIEIGATETSRAVNLVGGDSFEIQRAKLFQEVPALLEQEVLTGVLNGVNTLGTTTATRTMQGVRGLLTAINSTVVDSSFTANPHLYIGDAMQNCFDAGASTNENWGIIAGTAYFRDISNLNDTKVQDSNAREVFKRVIRQYAGPFGDCTVFLSRALAPREAFILPSGRLRVPPLNGRNFTYMEMGKTGDNVKGMVVGEYTQETFHPSAMARIRTSSPV